jgi:hypothetical protein
MVAPRLSRWQLKVEEKDGYSPTDSVELSGKKEIVHPDVPYEVVRKIKYLIVYLIQAIQHSFRPDKLENPMGERHRDALRVNFDRELKIECRGTKVTSDVDLLAYRALNDAWAHSYD